MLTGADRPELCFGQQVEEEMELKLSNKNKALLIYNEI